MSKPQPIVVPFNRFLITLSLLFGLFTLLLILYKAFNVSSFWITVFCALLFLLTIGISFRNVVDVLETYRQKSLFVIDKQGINYASVGIIAWQDIEYIQPYLENNRGPAYIYCIEIKIKNPELYAGKIKLHKRKSFQRLHILQIPRILLPLTAKKIVKQIAQEYGSYYLFRLDEHGLTVEKASVVYSIPRTIP